MPQEELLAQQACSFFLARLEAEISRLRGISFPGHDIGPRRWLNFISGVLDTGRQYLDQSRPPSTAVGKAEQLLEDAETLGERAYVFLKHVTGADATQIPHEIVAPFQRWVAGLGITNTIFFRSEHLANYELWQMDARALKNYPSASQSLVTAIDDINWPILRVTVPGHAMDMLPHFAVVAHELGHAIQDRIKPDLSTYASDRQSCDSRIAQRLANNGIAFGSNERLRVTTIFDKWLNEIKADSVGHFLVGPAFFFALFGFLELAGRSYGIADTHPPSDLRRQLLLNQLTMGSPSFADVFRAKTSTAITETINSPNIPACPQGDTLFQELRTEYGATDAAICTELVPYLQTIGAAVFTATQDYLDRICPNLLYSPQQLNADLGDPLDMLCALVPPIEARANSAADPEAMGLASILNIGWATLLTRLDRIPDKGGSPGRSDARRFDQLHQLLLKAVELSEARLLWSEHK
jgi:hypothetical protein